MGDKNNKNSFIKYSFIGVQMVVTVVIGMYVSKWVKNKFSDYGSQLETIVLLFFVFSAIYLVLKDFIKQ